MDAYKVLVKVIVAYWLIASGLGLSWADFVPGSLNRGQASSAFQKATKIEWRPISVFPEEAKRFQKR